MYEKLIKVWDHNDLNYIPKFKKVFPELHDIDREEMADRFIELGLDFYTTTRTPVNFLRRLSLPFAIIVLMLLFIYMPFNFIFTGNWQYAYNEEGKIYNWLKSLGLQS